MDEIDADVVVVGLGIWGACALWQLAARGHRVVGVDRFQPGHSFGASAGGSRMFRVTCLESPLLVPVARRARALWDELELAAGERLFSPVGGLLLGPPDGSVVGGTARAAREHGIEVELLDRDALRRRYPQHSGLGPDDVGLLEPSAGLLRAEGSVRAALRVAQRAGARVLPGTTVYGVHDEPGRVRVRTAAATLSARRAVLTTGPWLSGLVPGLPTTTVRMPITWFTPAGDPAPFDLARLPVFMRELGDGRILWGNGRESGHEVKLGLEVGDDDWEPIDPDLDDRAVGSRDWESLATVLGEHLPGLAPVPSAIKVCMFARTPDRQFLLGSPRDRPRIVLAGGCNAHGFKHAPAVGELVADLVEAKPTPFPLALTDPDRFGRAA